MGIQLAGLNNPTVAIAVDPTFDALHVSGRSMECYGWNMISTNTGNLTAAVAWVNTTGAGTIWSLRNNGPAYVAIRKVTIGFRLTTAFTTAQMMDYALTVGRNHITPFIAGTGSAILNTNSSYSSGKLNRSFAFPMVSIITAGTASLTALTAGNVNWDPNYLGYVNFWAGAIGAGIPPSTVLFESLPGEAPLVLRQNESVNVANVTLMGAVGVGIATINVEFAEIPLFSMSVIV
jgi:hypothetical protein